MAKLKFYIRTRSRVGRIRVYYSITRDNKPTGITDFYVEVSKWDKKGGCVKSDYTCTDPAYEELQKHLDDIRKIVINRHNQEGNNLPENWLQNIIDNYAKTNGLNDETFITYGERVIREYKAGTRLSLRNKIPAEDTITTFESQLNSLKDYEVSRKITLRFNNIDENFCRDFILYLTEKGASQNTAAGFMKLIQHILAHGRRDKLHQNMIDKTSGFKTPQVLSDEFPLTEDEVKAIEKLKFGDTPKEKRLEQSRDRFMIGICTAQRRRDYKYFNINNIDKINKIKVFRLFQHKSTNPVTIPLSRRLEKLLTKYGTNPPVCADTTFNHHVKLLCRRAGITQIVAYREKLCGQTLIKHDEKCNLISSHSARRTGATMLYLNGVDVYTIMRILGHSTPAQTIKYIRATPDQVAIHMAQSKIYVF